MIESFPSSSVLWNSCRSLGIDSPLNVWWNLPMKPQVLPARVALGLLCHVTAAPHRSPHRSPAFPPFHETDPTDPLIKPPCSFLLPIDTIQTS